MSGDHRERAVTVTLNYVLVLGISATVVAGLLFAGGTFVEDQRERVIEDELTVIGNHIASNVEQVDRLVQASHGTPDRVVINQSFQRTVSGTSYSVELQENPDQVVLGANSPEVVVRVNVSLTTALGESFAVGGDISVRYDAASDSVVIADG